jgi:hypothetical protein
MGKMIMLPNTLTMAESYPQTVSSFKKRVIVYVMFGIISIGPLIIFLLHRKTRNKNNKQTTKT